jgi:hypothetical protein
MTSDSDRNVAWICPKIGCMKSKKAPFKHGVFVQDTPLCPVHSCEMISLQESVTIALNEMLNFVYDKSLIPPKHFLDKLPNDPLKSYNFVMDWIYHNIAFRKYDKSAEYLDSLFRNYWKRNVSKMPLRKGSKLRKEIISESINEMDKYCVEYLRKNRENLEKLFKNNTYSNDTSLHNECIEKWIRTSYNDLKPILRKELFKNQSNNDTERYKTIIDLLLTAQNAAMMQGKKPPLKKITKPSKLMKIYENFAENNLTSEISPEDLQDSMEFLEEAICYENISQSPIVTRKFAVPMEKNELNELRKVFVKFRDYENAIVKHIMGNPHNESYEDFIKHFSGMGKEARKRANKHFGIEKLITNTYNKTKLLSRAKRSAFIYPYTSIREIIIRWEYIKQIAMMLSGIFTRNPSELKLFISKGKLSRDNSLIILDKIKYNCFNKFEKKSIVYLNILMGQLKNLMLREHVFEDSIVNELEKIKLNNQNLTNKLINSFTYSKNKKQYVVDPSKLLEFFQKIYTRSVKSASTRNFNLYQKNRSKPKTKIKPSQLVRNITKDLNIGTKDFRRLQNKKVNDLFSKKGKNPHVSLETIKSWCRHIINAVIEEYLDNESSTFEKSVIHPNYSKFHYQEISTLNFKDFIKNQLRNNIKNIITKEVVAKLNQNQVSGKITQFINVFMEDFNNLPKPHFNKLTFPIVDKDRVLTQSYNDSNGTGLFRFHPLGKTKKVNQFELIINQKPLERLNINDEDTFNVQMKSNPVLKLDGRKLIIAQPIVKNNIISNANTSSENLSVNSKEYIMGIDLGLKHYAVLSIWEIDRRDRSIKKEIARYFLNHKTIFQKHFNSVSGRFENVSLKNLDGDTRQYKRVISRPNVPRTLYHLKKEISALQTKSALILRDHPDATLSKYKLSKAISSKWRKLNNLHTEIANQVSVLIKRLAEYHNVSVIKFEDLKWSKHSKKRDTGFYLTQNQMHFIHGQIISKTKELVEFSSLIKVKMVNARWTSQLCSNCYKKDPLTITYKTQKRVVLNKIGVRQQTEFNHTCLDGIHRNLNSDLNAARVIALAPVLS